jgi:hypothetical protein
MGKYEIMFYNALLSVGPAIIIAWVTGDLQKVYIVMTHAYTSFFLVSVMTEWRPASFFIFVSPPRDEIIQL